MDRALRSIRKNKTGIILISICSILVAIGQVFWKISQEFSLVFFIMGAICYAIGSMVMILAYRYGSLSVLHPFMAINYFFSLIIGKIIFNENLNIKSILCVTIITIGVIFIGIGDE